MSFGSLTRSNPRTFQTNFPKTCDPPFFREWVRQVKKKQQKIIVPGTVGWYGIDLFNKPRDPDLNWTFFSWWPSLKLTAAKKNTWNARVGRWGFLIKGLFSDAMLLFVLGSVFWFFLLKCLNPNHLHVWFFSSSQHGFNTICRTKNEPWPCSRCFFYKANITFIPKSQVFENTHWHPPIIHDADMIRGLNRLYLFHPILSHPIHLWRNHFPSTKENHIIHGLPGVYLPTWMAYP